METPYDSNKLARQGLSIESFPFWGSPVLADRNGVLSCPGFIGNTYAASVWDKVYIGAPIANPYTPGICEVQVDKNRSYDVKKSSGSDGATVTFNGVEIASVTINVTIWTPEQFKALKALWAFLFPPVQKTKATGKKANQKGNQGGTFDNKASPFDVTHPELQMHNIRTLMFIGGSGPVPGNPIRARVFTMRAIEYLRPGAKTVVTNTPVLPLGSINDAPTHDTPGSNPKNLGPT